MNCATPHPRLPSPGFLAPLQWKLEEPSARSDASAHDVPSRVFSEIKITEDKDAVVKDNEAMTMDEQPKIGEKNADAREENFEKHDFVARKRRSYGGRILPQYVFAT